MEHKYRITGTAREIKAADNPQRDEVTFEFPADEDALIRANDRGEGVPERFAEAEADHPPLLAGFWQECSDESNLSSFDVTLDVPRGTFCIGDKLVLTLEAEK